MKTAKIIVAGISALLLLWLVLHTVFGAGFFARIATIGGIYAVPKPEGYNVVCFVEKHSGSMSCVPTAWMK